LGELDIKIKSTGLLALAGGPVFFC